MTWSTVSTHLTGLAHLATVTAVERPHVAIVSPRLEDQTVWIGALRTSKKVRNVAVRPFGALVWSATAEAYVDVAIELVDEVSEKRRLWNGWGYDPAAFFGSPEDDGYVLLRCTPTSATVVTMGGKGPQRLRWVPEH